MSCRSSKTVKKRHNSTRQPLNLVDFSFLDHKSTLSNHLFTKNTRHPVSLVENESDFWQFVNKYESMLRNMGQPVLPFLLHDSEHQQPHPYHKSKHLSLQLDDDQVKDHGIEELQTQFQQLLLIYLDFKQKEKFNRIKKLREAQKALPIARFKQDLRSSLETSRVLIVAGDTGCGKSTQVPQYLYEFGYRSIGTSNEQANIFS